MSAGKAVVNSVFTSKEMTKDIQTAYLSIKALEPLITKDVEQMAASLGNHMEGLQYSAKTASSVEDKLQREANKYQQENLTGDYDYESGLLRLKDVVRYTEICPHDQIVQTTKDTIAQMEKMGYVLSEVKNYYSEPYPGTQYMGMHLNFISPYGQEIELQVHSQESFDVKQEGHALYEQIRTVSLEEKDMSPVLDQIVKIHQSIPKCPDYWEIKNMSMDASEKEKLQAKRRMETDIDIDTKSIPNGERTELSVVYTVSVNNEEKMQGFEHTFSDGSAWSYRTFLNEGKTIFTCLDTKGDILRERDAEPMELTLDHVLEKSQQQEECHQRWMEEHKAVVMEMEGEEVPVRIEKEHDEKNPEGSKLLNNLENATVNTNVETDFVSRFDNRDPEL